MAIFVNELLIYFPQFYVYNGRFRNGPPCKTPPQTSKGVLQSAGSACVADIGKFAVIGWRLAVASIINHAPGLPRARAPPVRLDFHLCPFRRLHQINELVCSGIAIKLRLIAFRPT